MVRFPLSKLPLIFTFLSEKLIDTEQEDEDVNDINMPFYQTNSYSNHVFYKPISKFWHLEYESDKKQDTSTLC